MKTLFGRLPKAVVPNRDTGARRREHRDVPQKKKQLRSLCRSFLLIINLHIVSRDIFQIALRAVRRSPTGYFFSPFQPFNGIIQLARLGAETRNSTMLFQKVHLRDVRSLAVPPRRSFFFHFQKRMSLSSHTHIVYSSRAATEKASRELAMANQQRSVASVGDRRVSAPGGFESGEGNAV